MDEFDRIVERWHLRQHPFYQAWSAGTLPVEALREYAAEWGPFVAAVPLGWKTLGIEEHAAEEEEHAKLWAEFAADLGTQVAPEPKLAGARALVGMAERLFGQRESAIGALLAFEAQQPETAAAKLTGLQQHYANLGTSGRYFVEHAEEYGEVVMLKEMAAGLGTEGRARATAACEAMGQTLWEALTAVEESAIGAGSRPPLERTPK